MKKKLVVLTGAGISAESGISTFRDAGGLWEGHDVYEVASPEGWAKDPKLVLEFYNRRREQLYQVEPNRGHYLLAEMEQDYEVIIITQNIDDLHERAGSSKVIHLHGELKKSRSISDDYTVYDLPGPDLNWGDLCPNGFQLRPHVVWFGEAVPMIETAAMISAGADIYAVIGTSMQVYPAAGLINYASPDIQKFYVDPKAEQLFQIRNLIPIAEIASSGIERMRKLMEAKR